MATFITRMPAAGDGIRLQLIGGPDDEALLLATGAMIEESPRME